MKKAAQHLDWISRMRPVAASGVLALGAMLASAMMATQAVQAQTLTVLHSFDVTDGSYPAAGLVQGTNGNFYGATVAGGGNPNTNGAGTVFEITPSGMLTILYRFCQQSGCPDGVNPYAELVQAADGDFYGTTAEGGASETCAGGCGTIFKITPSGTLTTLHSFDSEDGAYPYGGLVQASNGNFYGTTSRGGAKDYGTVFKLTLHGGLRSLYSFCSQSMCADGGVPLAGLIQATDGSLYGTTEEAGAPDCDIGCGTLFKITPSGTLTTLHSFDSEDGAYPYGRLVQASNGNFYGTTFNGGANYSICFFGCGTVFSFSARSGLFTLGSLSF